MKKNYLYLALGLLAASCTKSEDTPQLKKQETAKKYAVTFNTSGFSQEVTDLSKSKGNSISAALKDHTNEFFYLVYDATGKEVSRQNQSYENKNNPNYGIVKDSLPAGTYTVVMVASKQYFTINRYNDEILKYFPLNEAFFHYDHRNAEYIRPKGDDTFYKKFSLTVSNAPITQKIILDRIVGKLEIKITDYSIDPNYSYYVYVPDETPGFYLNSGLPYRKVEDGDSASPAAIPGEGLTYYILNTSTPMNVVIIYRKNGEYATVIKKVIKNVQVYKNKKTILTGKMHDGVTQAGFNVVVDDEFGSETINVEF